MLVITPATLIHTFMAELLFMELGTTTIRGMERTITPVQLLGDLVFIIIHGQDGDFL